MYDNGLCALNKSGVRMKWSAGLSMSAAIRRPFLTRRGHFPSLFYICILHYKAFTWWYMGASVVNYYVMIFVCTRGQLLSCFAL